MRFNKETRRLKHFTKLEVCSLNFPHIGNQLVFVQTFEIENIIQFPNV